MQLATTTIQSNSMYPFTLQVKMCWSKNIVNKNESTTQFLFASMDPLVCPLLNLVVYFEHIRDEATYKGKPGDLKLFIKHIREQALSRDK